MESSSHSCGCLVPGKHQLFPASEHLNPSSGVPGREMQGEEAMDSVAGKPGGLLGGQGSRGVLLSHHIPVLQK